MSRKTFIGASLSGILIGISFGTLWGWLAFVGLVPLFFVVRELDLRQSYLAGIWTSFLFYLLSLNWIYIALHRYGGFSIFLSALAVVFMALVLSCITGFAIPLALSLHRRGCVPLVLALSASWVVIDYLRGIFPFGGFPWSTLAMPQFQNLRLIQIADVTGIWGVTFFVVWINAVVAELLLTTVRVQTTVRGEPVEPHPSTSSGRAVKLIATGLLCISIFGYGQFRLQQWRHLDSSLPKLRAGLIQGNIPQEIKLSGTHHEGELEVFQQKASRLQGSADLIVWPEAAWPNPLPIDMERLSPSLLGMKANDKPNPYSLIGAVLEESSSTGEKHYFNSAVLFNAKGELLESYQKIKRVPFGEYIPMAGWFPFLRPVAAREGFAAGISAAPLNVGWAKVGALICYEDIFPEISRQMVRRGAHLLVNLTNDAWYGISAAPYQHLALSVFRAVENRRFLLRATNTGISAVIGASGEVVAKTPLRERAVLVYPTPLLSGESPYVKWGDWFVLVCAAGMALTTLYERTQRKN